MRDYLLIGLLLSSLAAGEGLAEDVLYNGIALPDPWPPKVGPLTRDPLATPPYLASPPAVIPIDVGRQLFVDDFLVEQTNLARTHHQAQYHPASPVLTPEKACEGVGGGARRIGAGVFSDGVWYDPADKRFKAWYWGGSISNEPLGYCTCYATSRDGIHWEKPDLDVVPGTNIVLPDEKGFRRNSSVVWLDLEEKNPARRFKMFRNAGREESVENATRFSHRIRVSTSSDGIHWTLAGESEACGDRSTVYYNAFRRRWVYGLREGENAVSRCRG